MEKLTIARAQRPVPRGVREGLKYSDTDGLLRVSKSHEWQTFNASCCQSSFCTEPVSMLKVKNLVPISPLASVLLNEAATFNVFRDLKSLHSFSSLLALRTYRDSSSCRPNGCRAQGVSKSGSDFGPRQRSVATVASDQTWTDQRKRLKFKPLKRWTETVKEPHLAPTT